MAANEIKRDHGGNVFDTPAQFDFLGYEKLTVSNVATKFASVPDGTDSVLLRIEANDVRFLPNTVAPTSSNGFLLKTADLPVWWLNLGQEALLDLRFIRAGGADGEVHVVYGRKLK